MRLATALVFNLLFSFLAAQAATVTWQAAVSGNWNDATKWDTGAVPTAADDVVINAPGTYTVTLNTDAVCRDLTAGAASGAQTFSFAGGASLNVGRTGTFGTNTTFNLGFGHTLTGDGTVTFAGAFTWSGGTMSGTGRTVFAGGAW